MSGDRLEDGKRSKPTPNGRRVGNKSLGVHDVRNLRRAADTLADTADQHRAALIDRLGLKRYIFNALGSVAHQPASGCEIVWPDGVEHVNGVRAKLGDYLYAKAHKTHDLPQAILVGDKKFYL